MPDPSQGYRVFVDFFVSCSLSPSSHHFSIISCDDYLADQEVSDPPILESDHFMTKHVR